MSFVQTLWLWLEEGGCHFGSYEPNSNPINSNVWATTPKNQVQKSGSSIISLTLEQLSKNSNSQMSYLMKQGDDLMQLFESKPSPLVRPSVEVSPPQDFIQCQAQTFSVFPSQPIYTLQPLLALIEVASNKGLTKHL